MKGVSTLTTEYLNFAEISKKVTFKALFDYLNISYSQKNDEIKTADGIIVNIHKNLYFNTKDEYQKGSVINFLANFKETDLRTAAKELKDAFLSETAKPKREIPELELHYSDFLNQLSISKKLANEYEIGLVKQRSIMSGKIAFRIRDIHSNPIGYIGYNEKDNSWFYPKGFTRPLYNSHRNLESSVIFLVVNPFDSIKIISFGYPSVIALLGKSLNEEQYQTLLQLDKLEKIFLLHDEPDNLIIRLSKIKYVKCCSLSNICKLSKEEFIENLKQPC